MSGNRIDMQEALNKLNVKMGDFTRLAGIHGSPLHEDYDPLKDGRRAGRPAPLAEGSDLLRKVEEIRESRRKGGDVKPNTRSSRRPGTRPSLIEELRGLSRAMGLSEEFPAADTYHDGYRSSMRQDTIDRVPAPYTAVPAGELAKTFQNVANVADVITARVSEAIESRRLKGVVLENAEKVRRAMRAIANEAEDMAVAVKDADVEKKAGEEEPVIQITPKMAESLRDMIADIREASAFTKQNVGRTAR
jgi:hypothetical protein